MTQNINFRTQLIILNCMTYDPLIIAFSLHMQVKVVNKPELGPHWECVVGRNCGQLRMVRMEVMQNKSSHMIFSV